jgi:VanZ family protein
MFSELLFKSLPVDLWFQQANLQQKVADFVSISIKYSISSAEKGISDYYKFALACEGIQSIINSMHYKYNTIPDEVLVSKTLSPFSSKPVVGTVLLRYIQTLSKHLDYLTLNTKPNYNLEISESKCNKLSDIFLSLATLIHCLGSHNLPKQVRLILTQSIFLCSKYLPLMKQSFQQYNIAGNKDILHSIGFVIVSCLKTMQSFIEIYSKAENTDEGMHQARNMLIFTCFGSKTDN